MAEIIDIEIYENGKKTFSKKEIIETKICSCGNETFLENGLCSRCEIWRGEIVKAYLTLTCNSHLIKYFIALDLREGLAKRLLES